MYAYKFRLTFDEVEDFVRDYEILAEQTFKEFHDIILSSIGLDGLELASFYLCDSRWEKKKEVTLLDMDIEEEQQELAEEREGYIPKTIMSESVLSDFIDDPHQYLIFEYDFLNIKTFYIELVKTFEDAGDENKYPCCVYSVGDMPKPVNYSLDDDLDIDDEEDDEENEDYYDEEDFQNLSDDIEI